MHRQSIKSTSAEDKHCVSRGIITWTWAFVPEARKSMSDLQYFTQRRSIKRRESSFSTAMTTPSSFLKNFSSKMNSVSKPIWLLYVVTFMFGFNSLAAAAIVVDFFSVLDSRLDSSMQSSSVRETCPFLMQPTPIMAKIFINSRPMAPAPTTK